MTDSKLDFSALRRAITSLEDGLEVVGEAAWFSQQSAKVQNTLIAGVIQNFEFVYELGFKMLRRQLEVEAASPMEVDVDSFRDVLRKAGERGLVEDVEAWFRYRQMRNLTAHTYNQEKARQVYDGIRAFIRDARHLLTNLEARHGS